MKTLWTLLLRHGNIMEGTPAVGKAVKENVGA
jgi:hypothetical protein